MLKFAFKSNAEFMHVKRPLQRGLSSQYSCVSDDGYFARPEIIFSVLPELAVRNANPGSLSQH